MPFCDAEECGKEVSDNDVHTFAGYGYLLHFHAECCPLDFDGTKCSRSHPKIYRDWLGQRIEVGTPVLYAISQSHFAKLVWGHVLEIKPVPNPDRYFDGFRSFKLKIQPRFENVDVISKTGPSGRAIDFEYDPGLGRGEFKRALPKPTTVTNVEKVTVFPLPDHVVKRIEENLDRRVEEANERRRQQP